MNLINLMPHRHRRLQQRRRRFMLGLGMSVLVSAVLVLAASFTLERLHAQQVARNELLLQAKVALQRQEAQVRQLQAEIAVLAQRQATASALEQQRNVPVALFNELARLTPPGVLLSSMRQSDMKLVLTGVAVSDERVSDLMAGLQHDSMVLNQPELVELRSTAATRTGRPPSTGRAVDAQASMERTVDFTLSSTIRRPGPASGGQP